MIISDFLSFQNRAKELRSKLKEREGTQATSSSNNTPSTASKADLQRQRRSRQLEETQRLLDGYDLNNLNGAAYNPESAVCSDASVVSRRASNQDKESSHSSTRHIDASAHSIVSREQLGRIQSKYNSNAGKVMSTDRRDRDREYAALSKERCITRNGTSVEPPQLPDELPTLNLRDHPIEGRGRGRGRRRITTTSSNGSSLGEVSRTNQSIVRSRQQTKSKSPRLIDAKDISSEALQFYLRLASYIDHLRFFVEKITC